jgi:hypothetical protein
MDYRNDIPICQTQSFGKTLKWRDKFMSNVETKVEMIAPLDSSWRYVPRDQLGSNVTSDPFGRWRVWSTIPGSESYHFFGYLYQIYPFDIFSPQKLLDRS